MANCSTPTSTGRGGAVNLAHQHVRPASVAPGGGRRQSQPELRGHPVPWDSVPGTRHLPDGKFEGTIGRSRPTDLRPVPLSTTNTSSALHLLWQGPAQHGRTGETIGRRRECLGQTVGVHACRRRGQLPGRSRSIPRRTARATRGVTVETLAATDGRLEANMPASAQPGDHGADTGAPKLASRRPKPNSRRPARRRVQTLTRLPMPSQR